MLRSAFGNNEHTVHESSDIPRKHSNTITQGQEDEDQRIQTMNVMALRATASPRISRLMLCERKTASPPSSPTLFSRPHLSTPKALQSTPGHSQDTTCAFAKHQKRHLSILKPQPFHSHSTRDNNGAFARRRTMQHQSIPEALPDLIQMLVSKILLAV